MKRSLLVLLAAAALPASAGVHFNGDIHYGQYKPEGFVSFNGKTPLVIGENYKLGRDAGIGADIHFDVGHWNFGAGGWQSSFKESGAPSYGFVLNGVPLSTADILSNRLDVTQYDAWGSYEWDLAKYVPGVSMQLGPMVKAVRTTVKTRINFPMNSAANTEDSTNDTALAIGGRFHVGFIKDLLSLDAQAAFNVTSDHRYQDLQAKLAIHPVPFFYAGVGYRDNRVQARAGNFDLYSGTWNNDRFDVKQRGWNVFLGWRIGAGGR